jgi:tetraacyldisaccharide 4'-kinase
VNEAGQAEALDLLRELPVAAVCGIGNPAAFRRTLTGLDAQLTAFRVFPDHHAYTRADLEDLRSWARQQPAAGLIVTTQKDLVKLRVPQLGGRPLWAVQIALHITRGSETLARCLQQVLPPGTEP